MIHHLRGKLALIALLALLPLSGGCAILGYAADKTIPDPSTPTGETYKGLKGKICAIMVFTDFAAKTDYSELHVVVGRLLQEKLESEGRDQLKRSELEKTTFPYSADSIQRFLREHPDTHTQPITVVAQRLGVKDPKGGAPLPIERLIYVEIRGFQTRYPNSSMLYRGEAEATLRVVEVNGDSAKIALQDDHIKVSYPSGDEPTTGVEGGDQEVYNKTLTRLIMGLAYHFYDPPVELK